MTLPESLKNHRIKANLTQKQVSLITGIKQPDICRLESPQLTDVKFSTLQKLAKCYRTTVAKLVTGITNNETQ